MIKKLIAASTILGAAALLSNKARRDRIADLVRGFMNTAGDEADKVAEKTLAPSSSVAHTQPPKWVRPGGY